ncbi:polyamine-modulated factor 1-binding protein 1 [Perognathus longimembris pacificus]|uniref:polyamine-modulated factor 1-binding protein 1 n=1 Tax=Perognathus longimembris pacificus TaxID=214514 RepID=UPI0020197ACB|nr:polyamine-modulated factor 1-binding protein 1 [Perognathus longimembris pacificus]
MLKLKGELRAAKGLKDEAQERDREVSGLNSKLLSLQLDIKNLHDVCKRQGKTLQENQLCVEEAMMNDSHNKKQAKALAFREAQMEFGSTKQCHLRQLQQLKKKLIALQQELEFRTEELQTSYCSLLQYQSILEKQTSDLVILHHHCKLKEDEVTFYEEEMGNHNVDTEEKLHLAHKQLALAGDKIVSLERSLNLYRDKYQTSLSNIELLECQVKMLEGELSGIISQDPENKGDHSKVRLYPSSCMIQEHQETLKRLSEVWQKVSEQDDLIQELRNKLACSNALVLERDEALIKLQADFSSYTATHRYPPSSSEDGEDIKKILKHLQEQKDSQCQNVEEYKNLVKDLRTELETVSEQKKNVMKDMMKLELDLHRLREDASAHSEKKDRETGILQRQLDELQQQCAETKKVAADKDKMLHDKEEMLHELERKVSQVQGFLRKKELELEKNQSTLTEMEETLKEAKQDSKHKMECEALRAEVQKLQDLLDEAKQQHKVTGQQLSQCKDDNEELGHKLEDTQKKLQNCIQMDKEKSETIDSLQKELQKHQRRASTVEGQLLDNRKQAETLSSELGEALKKLENADKEKKQLQKTLVEQDIKINEMLSSGKVTQHQQKELEKAKAQVEAELQDTIKLMEEKQDQLKKNKEKEKSLEDELDSLQQEVKRKEKTWKDNLRKMEDENKHLQDELANAFAQLESAANKCNATQKTIDDLNLQLNAQKESKMNLQMQLDSAIKKEKLCMQNMVSKDAFEELSRKSHACQDDLTQALEKLNHATSETKNLQRALQQAQERKSQLEDEILAYEDRMKKVNVELKKLQNFHQESELEVRAFDKKLEEMSNQVLQWQKQHQSDLKMLAAKESQLRSFQEEMATLKENLLADEKEVGTPSLLLLPFVPSWAAPAAPRRAHRENDQTVSNMEQWAKEQKIANEKLGNKLREQVKYIAKLTGEKDQLHNVMVHLQQENKKLKSEIEEKKMKTCNPRLGAKTLIPSKLEHTPRGKACGVLGWKDAGHKTDMAKCIGLPHYSVE